ncbi:MAG: replication factor C large subunit [Nitrososphaerota archaeon]|nr:replication factor C large subunit [Candidatus Bathyarchaeota archaeon]MCX8162830.1 replication factor C large subunit [Candidatus Bathyarchaeota archaeon]MDW8061967.1 replication factor C large subunit [Nitrososphaerota archaeon]
MSIPWIVKYRPKRVEEVVGNDDSKKKFIEWIESWVKGEPIRKAALLYGPAGVGKTSLVEAVAKTYGYDLVELNASDQRSETIIKRIVGIAASQGTLTGSATRRIILLDEVDGMSEEDRGGLKAIVEVLERTRQPIVLTANDAWDPKLTPLRSVCLMIEFKRLKQWEVVKKLRDICLKEGIEADREALEFIAKRSEGDLRSAINDLQIVAQGRMKITIEDVGWLPYRNRIEPIFDVLSIIFNAKTISTARRALSLIDIDPDMMFEWIYENLPSQLTDPKDLAVAMENLAKADLIRSRVKLFQRWDLLAFATEIMSGGVAVAREATKPRWTPFHFPERIKFLSSIKEERGVMDSIASKIASRCLTSKRTVISDVIPYILFMLMNNPDYGVKLLRNYDLTSSEIEFLKGKVGVGVVEAPRKRGRSAGG